MIELKVDIKEKRKEFMAGCMDVYPHGALKNVAKRYMVLQKDKKGRNITLPSAQMMINKSKLKLENGQSVNEDIVRLFRDERDYQLDVLNLEIATV